MLDLIYYYFKDRHIKRGEVVDFNASGRLPAGFHDCTVEEFASKFVSGFPTSQRRKPIFNSMIEFCIELFAQGIPAEFWVDGSYATTKTNPNDADIVVFLHYSHYLILKPIMNDLRSKYRADLDIYFAVAVSDDTERVLSHTDFTSVVNMRNYWRGQFCFDREDNPKGIIRISCDSIKNHIDRR